MRRPRPNGDTQAVDFCIACHSRLDIPIAGSGETGACKLGSIAGNRVMNAPPMLHSVADLWCLIQGSRDAPTHAGGAHANRTEARFFHRRDGVLDFLLS